MRCSPRSGQSSCDAILITAASYGDMAASSTPSKLRGSDLRDELRYNALATLQSWRILILSSQRGVPGASNSHHLTRCTGTVSKQTSAPNVDRDHSCDSKILFASEISHCLVSDIAGAETSSLASRHRRLSGSCAGNQKRTKLSARCGKDANRLVTA